MGRPRRDEDSTATSKQDRDLKAALVLAGGGTPAEAAAESGWSLSSLYRRGLVELGRAIRAKGGVRERGRGRVVP